MLMTGYTHKALQLFIVLALVVYADTGDTQCYFFNNGKPLGITIMDSSFMPHGTITIPFCHSCWHLQLLAPDTSADVCTAEAGPLAATAGTITGSLEDSVDSFILCAS